MTNRIDRILPSEITPERVYLGRREVTGGLEARQGHTGLERAPCEPTAHAASAAQ